MTEHGEHDDDRADEVIREMARAYNAPPVTPRDDMWTAILAARTYNAPPATPRQEMWEAIAGRGSRVAGRVTPSTQVREIRRAPWWAMAVAAVLLLAVGIGIGVRMGSRAASQIAQRDSIMGVPSVAPLRVRQPDSPRGAPDAPREMAETTPRGQTAPLVATDAPAGSPYNLATVKHLTEAEALLTSFRSNVNEGRMDAQVASWARELLTNTRLLIDSPAATDPLRRKLFQDLELVLVQIVQLAPNPRRDRELDRDLIEGTLDKEQVLTRLRTAIPAGQTRGT